MRTALGLRAHSGWAAVVAVAGTADSPCVLDRQRIVIADPEMAGSKQPYHAAAELPPAKAAEFVRRAVESSRALALAALKATVASLASQGHAVVGCAILAGSGRSLPGLAGILAAHPLIHTAEGEMFREVLVWAAEQCHIPVTRIREKEIDATVLESMAPLGKAIGPPWTQDQKYAAAAAITAGCL